MTRSTSKTFFMGALGLAALLALVVATSAVMHHQSPTATLRPSGKLILPSAMTLRGGMGSRSSRRNAAMAEEEEEETESSSSSSSGAMSTEEERDDESSEASSSSSSSEEEQARSRRRRAGSGKSMRRGRSKQHVEEDSEEDSVSSSSSSSSSAAEEEEEEEETSSSSSTADDEDEEMDEDEEKESGSRRRMRRRMRRSKEHEDESDTSSSSSAASTTEESIGDDTGSVVEETETGEEEDEDEDEEDDQRMAEDDESDFDEDDDTTYGAPKRLTYSGPESREMTVANSVDRDLAEKVAHDDGSEVVVVDRDDHGASLLSGLEFLRARHAEHGSAKSFCDVALEGGGAHVPAHKCLLAAISPELEALVNTADKKGVVKLSGVEARGLHAATAFIYNGTVDIPRADLPAVLKASDVLSLRPLKNACLDNMLAELSPLNAIKTRALGHSLPCEELTDAAQAMCMEEFSRVSRTNEFMELDAAHVHEMLSCDDLLANSEVDVLSALLSWVEHDETNRAQHLLPLLGDVRLGLLTTDTLAKKVAAAPLIQKHLSGDARWQAMINSALAYVGSPPDSRSTLEGPQTKVRLGSRGRYVFCIGGRRGGSPRAQSRSWMLDKHNFDWFEVEPMAYPRKQHATAELSGHVYAAGGWDGSQYLRSVERFSPVDDAWQRVALMGSSRGSFGLVSAKGALVAAGGFDGLTHLASVEMYNVTSNTWVSGPPLTVGRSGLRLVESAGSLYAIGGFDGTDVLPTVERLAPGESQWMQVAPMLEGRRDHAVAVDEVTGKIIVTGGFDGTGDLASAEEYDPSTDAWVKLPAMESARSGHDMCMVKGKVHVVGGYDGSRYLSDSEILHGEAWEESPDTALPVRLAHFALTTL